MTGLPGGIAGSAVRPEPVDVEAMRQAVGPAADDFWQRFVHARHRRRCWPTVTANGVLGDPRSASANMGHRLLAAAAQAVGVELLRQDLWR